MTLRILFTKVPSPERIDTALDTPDTVVTSKIDAAHVTTSSCAVVVNVLSSLTKAIIKGSSLGCEKPTEAVCWPVKSTVSSWLVKVAEVAVVRAVLTVRLLKSVVLGKPNWFTETVKVSSPKEVINGSEPNPSVVPVLKPVYSSWVTNSI